MTAGVPRQCAVLAGGLGTRLGALTHETPKPMLDIAGRPFLAWLLREALRWGAEEFVLLTGHLSERVEAARQALADSLPRTVPIHLSPEPVRAGTGGALYHARALLDERFILMNGDSLLIVDPLPALAAFAQDPLDVACRMVLRPVADASRYGVAVLEGDRVDEFHERGTAGQGLINSGVYLMNRRVAEAAGPTGSLERDLLPHFAAQGAVRGTIADGWFIDIGIPDDLARARADLPDRMHRPALFLDRDGVLNHDHGWVGTRARWEWIDGAKDAVRRAWQAGWQIFIVTNQSGIARGHYTEQDVEALHAWMQAELRQAGGSVDDIRFCPFHPEASVAAYRRVSTWRKPAPGMIMDLVHRWGLDPARCILVGDHMRDIQAAEAAGIRGYLFPGGNLDSFIAPLLHRATP